MNSDFYEPTPDNLIASLSDMQRMIEKTKPGSIQNTDPNQFHSFVMNSLIQIGIATQRLLMAELEEHWPDRIQR